MAVAGRPEDGKASAAPAAFARGVRSRGIGRSGRLDVVTLAFDFDGTIIDSESVKLAAFARLFEGLPQQPLILDYNARNRGIPRREKLEYVCSQILHSPDLNSEVERLLIRYGAALDTAMTGCRPIRGIREFLRSLSCPRFVVSSAPREEIDRQLERFDMAGLIDGPERGGS